MYIKYKIYSIPNGDNTYNTSNTTFYKFMRENDKNIYYFYYFYDRTKKQVLKCWGVEVVFYFLIYSKLVFKECPSSFAVANISFSAGIALYLSETNM